MSGHSKWASIKHKKGAADAKRGKIFTRHAKLIEIAARAGGPDIGMNAALKTAVDNAKAENVPNNNIDRAIKKGSGELKGEATAEVIYEAYGPGGSALIIECLTDNKNRTLPNVKMILNKKGGNFAESGSVMYMFERKGFVLAEVKEGMDADELELELIDYGAEDIEIGEEMIEITTDVSSWTKVRDYLKEKEFEVSESGLKYVSGQTQDLDDEKMEKVANLIEALEEDEDVSQVHTNVG